MVDIDGVDAELELRGSRHARRAAADRRSDYRARPACVFPDAGNAGTKFGRARIAAGIDMRGDRRLCRLAPPSIHPSGRAYTWSVDSASSIRRGAGLVARQDRGTSANGNGHSDASHPSGAH